MQSPTHLKFRTFLIVRIDLLSSASFKEASDVLTFQMQITLQLLKSSNIRSLFEAGTAQQIYSNYQQFSA